MVSRGVVTTFIRATSDCYGSATFHPKNRLDDGSIAGGHYFLPLPPYSPELNPIEQFWATLKRKVVELLRTGRSVHSALEYYFKTK